MVTKNQIKLIKSLHQKKYRKEHQLFIAEGVKVISELTASSLILEHLYCTEPVSFNVCESKITLVTKDDLKKMSALSTITTCLALFRCIEEQPIQYDDLIVALDDIRDPGNLGTIIRLCDWFGIKHIICTNETVDLYNPKVVQATMGSLSRVNLVYGDLPILIKEGAGVPVYGTFMDGSNIYNEQIINSGIIVMGNEANGISKKIEQLVTQKLAIPRFGSLQQTESLNVAMAASIVLSEFRRHNF